MATQLGIDELLTIKSEIEIEIEKYGSDLTILSRTSADDIDDFGQPIFTEGSSVTISAVPYNNTPYNILFNNTAALNDGETRVIVNGDADIQMNDKLTFQGNDYKVVDYEIYGAANINVALDLRIGRV